MQSFLPLYHITAITNTSATLFTSAWINNPLNDSTNATHLNYMSMNIYFSLCSLWNPLQEEGHAQASAESKALPGSVNSGSVTVNSLSALQSLPLPFICTGTQTGCGTLLVDIIITLNTLGLVTVDLVTCTQGRLKRLEYTRHWFRQPRMDSGENNMHCTERNTYCLLLVKYHT